MPRQFDEPFISSVCDYQGGIALHPAERQRRRHVFGLVQRWCQEHPEYTSASEALEPCKCAIAAWLGMVALEAALTWLIERLLTHYFGG